MNNLVLPLMLILSLLGSSASIFSMESGPNNQGPCAMETEESCPLCFNEMPHEGFRKLGCGHKFCVECLKDLLSLGLDKEWAQGLATYLRCPRQNCRYQMNEQDIQTISHDPARVARYHEILTQLFINANRNMRRCPTQHCEVVYEIEPHARIITCERGCQAQYCSHCRESHAAGERCGNRAGNNNPSSELRAGNNNIQRPVSPEREQEEQYQEWLHKNTKPCPECKVNIQKNGGCKHMTCKMCKHEFCWDCLGKWKLNRFHPTFYQCNAGGAGDEQPEEIDIGAIDNPLPIDNLYPNGQTLLMYAVQNNRPDILRRLLDGQDIINQNDDLRQNNTTLLLEAARRGNPEILEYLINAQPEINLNDEDQQPHQNAPWLDAARYGDDASLRRFIRAGLPRPGAQRPIIAAGPGAPEILRRSIFDTDERNNRTENSEDESGNE